MTELPRGSEGSEHVHVNGEDGSRTRASGNTPLGHDPNSYSHQYEESLRAGTAAYDGAHGGESGASRSPRQVAGESTSRVASRSTTPVKSDEGRRSLTPSR